MNNSAIDRYSTAISALIVYVSNLWPTSFWLPKNSQLAACCIYWL